MGQELDRMDASRSAPPGLPLPIGDANGLHDQPNIEWVFDFAVFFRLSSSP
ncbi:hypothetical protein [Nonomuraea sp. NPDC048916]|uniref:hypothetical protein n=1 Tax=Nonomuraea sp. NPDC048916 TaxID=3154232 RepID=UPI0033F1183E